MDQTSKDPRDTGPAAGGAQDGGAQAPQQQQRPQAAAAVTKNPLAPPGASDADHEAMAATVQPRPRRRIEDDEERVRVDVHTPFNLTADDGMVTRYHKGEQRMPASHAGHWYAKLHLDLVED